MADKFIILIGNEQFEYNNFEDIPESFDYLIKFEPEYPDPPHTEEQHEYINSFPLMLQELMSRERKHYAKENRNRTVKQPRSPEFRILNG